MKAFKKNPSQERLSYLQAADSDFGNISVVFEPQKNLDEEFQNASIEELGYNLQVFLRVRPSLTDEDEDTQVDISDDNSVQLTAPASSNTFKNSVHGVAKLCHKFSFSHVFKPEALQTDVYDNTTKGLVADFISGQNCLLFAYGATNSGKTYTIQGTPGDPGILPRTFEQIFNSIGDNHYKHQDLKPRYFSGVCKLDSREIQKEEEIKENLFKVNFELSSVLSQSTQSLTSALSKSGATESDLSSVITELSTVSGGDRNSREHMGEPVYALFLSVVEIYNEIVYDLLDASTPRKNSRTHLNLGEDRKGATYIKGLREVRIRSLEEALRLLEVSRQNLHFAATKLNHNSSRSHCICTIKLVHLASNDDPHVARVSMLSLCDLAGAERTTKTQGCQDRVKEASNINTSLLVLKRCIDALRRNHSKKSCKKKECPVPYRDSKLTRIFQAFFFGRGKASMIVNIAKTPIIFDETLQVLKFSALAKQVQICRVKEEESLVLPSRRPSQFSRLIRQSFNTSGRLSVPWANCSINNITFGGTKPEGQEDVMEAVEEEEDERYDELIEMIEKLKNELVSERKSKYEMEVKLRDELCNEFSKQIVEIESSWSERLRNEVAKTEELSDWRMNMLMRSIKKPSARKRLRTDDDPDEEYVESIYLFQEQVKVKERDDKIADQELQIKQLDEELAVLKKTLKKTNEACTKLQKENTANVFQLAKLTESLDKTNKAQVQSLNSESRTDGLVISDLQHQMDKTLASLKEKEKEVATHKEMLVEAAVEFLSKDQENAKLSEELQTSNKIIAKQALELNELQGQLEATRLHLSEVVQRSEELEEAATAAANAMNGPNLSHDTEKDHRLKTLEYQVFEFEGKVSILEKERKELEKKFKKSNSQVQQLQEEHLREKSKLLLEVAALKRSDGTFPLSPRKAPTPIKVMPQEVQEMDLLKQEKSQLLEDKENLKAQLSARKEELDNVKESQKILQTEKELLSNRLQETNDLFEHLRSANAMTESLKEQALKEKEELEFNVRELSEKLISIQENRAADLLDLSNLRSDAGQSAEKIEDMKNQLKMKEEELERLQKEHKLDKINDLQKLVKEHEGQQKSLEDKEEEVVRLQEHVKELEGELKSLKEEMEGEKENIAEEVKEIKLGFESKKREHKKQVEDMKETLDLLTKELEELKERLRSEQEENKEKVSKEEMEKLVEERNALEKKVKTLEGVNMDKEELVEKKAKLEAELERVSAEHKQLEVKWQEEEETLRKNQRDIIDTLEVANKALAEEIRNLNEEVLNLSEKMKMSEMNGEELKSDLLLAQTTLQQKEENSSRLQDELDCLKSEHENCEKIIIDHKESMSMKLESLMKELDVLNETGTREVEILKESHAKELKTLEDAHSSEVEKLEALVKEMEVKVSNLEEKLAEKLKKLEDVELELEEKLLQVKELKKQQNETRLESLDRALSIAEEKMEEKKQMSTTVEELQTNLESTEAKCEILQKENAALKEARQEEIGILHAQAQEKEDLVASKDQEITALQKEVKMLLSQKAKTMETPSETKSPIRRESTRSVKSEPEEQTAVINTLQQQVRHNESERLSLVSEVMDLRKQLDDAKLRMHELQEKCNSSVITVPDTPTPNPTPVNTARNSSSVRRSTRSSKKMQPTGTDKANFQSPAIDHSKRTPQETTTQDSLHLCLEPSEGEESIASVPKISAKKGNSRPRRTLRNLKALNDSFEYNIKMAGSQGQESEEDVWEPPTKPMKPPRNTRTKAKKKTSVHNPHLENQENQRNVAVKENVETSEDKNDTEQEGSRRRRRPLYKKTEDDIFLEVPNLLDQQKMAEDSPHSLVRRQLRMKRK
ncbi:uncharacterized protein LOC143035120 isoform X2 [Oratosquilla oratoria]|uniref:uncharacterized protein LOC143035120 isoform X2 n=1 Tax=Oratosquilla oratoria TaxID=337810 RepID=UPI003F776C9D